MVIKSLLYMSIIDQVEMCRINRQSGKQRMFSKEIIRI